MCNIKSSKNSPFLKTSSLNPTAQEWRPPHLHLHHPAPPPPLTAAHVAALVAHPPPKQLLWHFLPQPQCFFHLYSPPPLPLPPLPPPPHPLPPLPPPPQLPLLCGERKGVSQLEEKRVVKCLEKLERLIVKARCEMPKTPPPPLPPLPERWVWRPKTSLASAAAAAPPPPPASPLIEGQPSRTTVMVKNIPNQLRKDFMLEFLDSYCKAHLLEYDFMYLPMDFRSKDNLGYAFVNFTNGEYALKFKKILHCYKWRAIKTDNGVYTSKKICAITWARIQGKEKLVERFKSSIFRCDNPDFLPVVFDPPRGGSNATSPVIVGRLSHAT